MNIYALSSYVAQPAVFLYLALGLAIFRMWWMRPELRRGLRGVIFFYWLFALSALPLTEHFVLGGLENQNPASTGTLAEADAIVVLSGDVIQPDTSHPAAEPGPSTLYRCLHAADLYREKARPIIATGATSDPDSAEVGCALVMQELLVKLGVRPDDLIIENGSFSTFENALACRRIVHEKNFRKVILVTDASHMPRALHCFRSQGIDVIPSGCQYRSPSLSRELFLALPTLDAAKMVQRASHEWQGILWYWLRGRI